MGKPGTHPVWMIENYDVKYIEGTKKVECRACTRLGITKFYSSVTTNMETHLRTQHSDLYEKMQFKQIEMKNEGRRIIAEAQRKKTTPGTYVESN